MEEMEKHIKEGGHAAGAARVYF